MRRVADVGVAEKHPSGRVVAGFDLCEALSHRPQLSRPAGWRARSRHHAEAVVRARSMRGG